MRHGRRTIGRLLGTVLVVAATATAGLTAGAGSAVAAPVRPHTLLTRSAEARLRAEQPAPGHRTTSAAVRTGTREALQLRRGTDEDPYLAVDPGCVGRAGGKAAPDATVFSSRKLELDYVLTGPDDYRRTGTVTVKAGKETSLGLPSVKLGTYRLMLALHGSSTSVADQTFDMLRCVQVRASCHAVTFTNPVGNPSAHVVYEGHKKNQRFDLDLAPGASARVRADYSRVDYEAYGYFSSGDRAPARLGDGKVSVEQHCSTRPAQPGSNALQSSADVSCSGAGAPGDVILHWSVQPSVKKARYAVLDASLSVIKSGKVSGDTFRTFSLPAGDYHYRSYANGIVATPFEDVAFSVRRCVQVTPVCKALEVDNPNAYALDVSVSGSDEDDESDPGTTVETTAAASATTTIAWDRTTAYVLVTIPGDDGTSRFVDDLLTPDLGLGDVGLDVPQRC